MSSLPSIYPTGSKERDKWILERRPTRESLDPLVPYAFSSEDERSSSGEIVPVATIFLTNKECPWRCLMCDLWRNTTLETVPLGAIPTQIRHALAKLPPARHIKLYNSGSFFDRQAIPARDYPSIAACIKPFERVIVESHPALLGESCLRFRDMLKGKLEVAMGLETSHSEVLARLNKRMTLKQFAAAAAWLRENDINLRVFILVKPPFMDEDASLYWANRSLDFAFSSGASVAALIPTRAGNGALDHLAEGEEFSPPALTTLEAAAAYGVDLRKGRVFADLWDLQRISKCDVCLPARYQRLNEMNLHQVVRPPVYCAACGGK